MASIEYTPPVLPPPPPAHHPPPSAYRRASAPLAISGSARKIARPHVEVADQGIPLTARCKRSPLGVVDKNIPLRRRSAPSSTEKIATSSSQAALFSVPGRVLTPLAELEGILIDSAAMIERWTPQHQEIGAIAIKSNKATSTVFKARSDVPVQMEDTFGLEDDDASSELSVDNAFAANTRAQSFDLWYATTDAQIEPESKSENDTLPETREKDGIAFVLTENACNEINGELALLTLSATVQIGEDTSVPVSREHVAPSDMTDKYSEEQEQGGGDNDAQETLDDTSLQPVKSFGRMGSEGESKASADESFAIMLVNVGAIEDGASALQEKCPPDLSHDTIAARIEPVFEPKDDTPLEPTKASEIILAREICDQDNEPFKLYVTLSDELGIDDDCSYHQENGNKAEHSPRSPLVVCNFMADAQTDIIIPSQALSILRLLTAGVIRATNRLAMFTHTWSFPFVKQSGSMQSLDYPAEPSPQETHASSTTEDKQNSHEMGEAKQPGTELTAVCSLGPWHKVIARSSFLALNNKSSKACKLSRKRISARWSHHRQRILAACHAATHKNGRGRHKQSSRVCSQWNNDPNYSPSIQRACDARSKEMSDDAPVATYELQGKIYSAGSNTLDHHLLGTKDAPKSPSRPQDEDILEMEPGASCVMPIKMIALDSSPDDHLSNTDEASGTPQSQGTDIRPTAPGAYCAIPFTLIPLESSSESVSAVSESRDWSGSSCESVGLNPDNYLSTSIKHISPSASQSHGQDDRFTRYRATPPMVVPKPSSDTADKSVADEEERDRCWGTFLNTLQLPLFVCFPRNCGREEV